MSVPRLELLQGLCTKFPPLLIADKEVRYDPMVPDPY